MNPYNNPAHRALLELTNRYTEAVGNTPTAIHATDAFRELIKMERGDLYNYKKQFVNGQRVIYDLPKGSVILLAVNNAQKAAATAN